MSGCASQCVYTLRVFNASDLFSILETIQRDSIFHSCVRVSIDGGHDGFWDRSQCLTAVNHPHWPMRLFLRLWLWILLFSAWQGSPTTREHIQIVSLIELVFFHQHNLTERALSLCNNLLYSNVLLISYIGHPFIPSCIFLNCLCPHNDYWFSVSLTLFCILLNLLSARTTVSVQNAHFTGASNHNIHLFCWFYCYINIKFSSALCALVNHFTVYILLFYYKLFSYLLSALDCTNIYARC